LSAEWSATHSLKASESNPLARPPEGDLGGRTSVLEVPLASLSRVIYITYPPSARRAQTPAVIPWAILKAAKLWY